MPDLEDFKTRLQQLGDTLRARLPEIAETLVLSAKAIAERKIKEQGIGEQYSTNPIPAWFFHGKELNSGGQSWLKQHGVNEKGEAGDATYRKGKKLKKKEKATPEDRLGTWGEFRAAQGLQSSHVDYSYTNKMWAAMLPGPVTESTGIYSCSLGATNTEAQQKMNWNRDRDGDFIGKALSEQDFTTLKTVVVDGVLQIINDSNL